MGREKEEREVGRKEKVEKEGDVKGKTGRRKKKGERGRDEVIWGEREERKVGRVR